MTIEIIIISLQVVIGLISSYLIYYVRQKGKNQADREDLGKLTQIVEDVKQKYVTDNELLKSSLALFTNKQNTLFIEGKNAIIEFYSNLNKWLWHSLNTSAHEYNQTNFTELTNRILTMKDHYNDTNISYGKIQLLVNDDLLVKAGHDAIMETLYLHQFMEINLKELQSILLSDKLLSDQLFSKDFKFDNLSPEMKGFYERQANDNSAGRKKIIDDFTNKRSTLFSSAMTKRNVFRDLGKNYLLK